MKTIVPLCIALVSLLAACGPRPAPSTEPEPPAQTDTGAPPAGPAMPAPTGDPRADLLATLRTFQEVDVELWPAEMEPILYPNGTDPLLGASREELLAALGAPDADPGFQGEDRLAWDIGVLAAGVRSAPPVLVVVLDDAGVAVEAFFQLAR